MSDKDKSLKSKAIDIKGKEYVLVSDRVKYFNEEYPNGSIETYLVSNFDSDTIVVRATVTPDVSKPERKFSDYAQEVIGSSFINKTSAMENASTSAVGRALGFMGIGVLDSIASADEINKATSRSNASSKKATDKQIEWMRNTVTQYEGDLDGEGVDKIIEDILTIKPQDVPVFKVKDAVDKITEVLKREQEQRHKRTDKNIEELSESLDITDEDLNLDDIPY